MCHYRTFNLLIRYLYIDKTNCSIVSSSEQHNIIDALMNGAGNALKICGYLIANLIAFISVLNYLDLTISWFFNLVHHPEINFQYLLGLAFYPFALVIGIPLRDCLLASKLIGIKVSLNEVRNNMFIKIIYFVI
jgi:nucleoside permease NupC